MSDMKLILENWRRYVTEQSAPEDLGPLYIFENDTVRSVSFSERLNMLTESEGDLLLFIEQWERSVDYALETLEEGLLGQLKLFGSDPIGFLSTQAFHLLEKLKQAPQMIIKGITKVFSAGSKVIKLSERIRGKHPKMWKLGVTVGLTIIASAVAILLVAIPEAMAGDLVSSSGELISNAEELSKHADLIDQTVSDAVAQAREAYAAGDEAGTRELIETATDLKESADLLRQIAENPDDQSLMELGVNDARKAEATVEELRAFLDANAESASEAAGAAGDASGIPGVSIDAAAGELQVEIPHRGGDLADTRRRAVRLAQQALEKAGHSIEALEPTGGNVEGGNLKLTFKFTSE